MIKTTIRQHCHETRSLFDIATFLEHIDRHFSVTHWEVDVSWCMIRKENEQRDEWSVDKTTVTDQQFRELYADVYQTIDGRFTLFSEDDLLAKLVAVDSSFWTIESSDRRFVEHMLSEFGPYQSAL